MKKTAKFLVIFFAGLVVLSCAKKKDSNLELEVVGNSKVYLIPAATQSCANQLKSLLGVDDVPDNDVPNYYFTVPNVNLNWKGTDSIAHIVLMRVELTGTSITGPACTLVDGELQAIFHNYQATPLNSGVWNRTILPAGNLELNPNLEPSFRNSGCQVRCGGFKPADLKKTATSQATLTVIGFERKANGEELPLRVEKNITVNYE